METILSRSFDTADRLFLIISMLDEEISKLLAQVVFLLQSLGDKNSLGSALGKSFYFGVMVLPH